jgi:methylamine dehydrogenase heavy chain
VRGATGERAVAVEHHELHHDAGDGQDGHWSGLPPARPSAGAGVFRAASCVLYGAVVLLRRHRSRPVSRPLLRAAVCLGALLGTAPAIAATAEALGAVTTLPEQPGPHWFWLSDIILHRTALFDADSGGLLGTITSGSPGVGFAILPLVSPDHREVYLAESYFSRGVRGERTDVVTIYDARTLEPLNEIPLPPKRAEYFPGNASSALSDDGRFLAVFNLTPVTSLSIVDARARSFMSEVATPGCSLVYSAGPRRFFMLCANGEALLVTLDDSGAASLARSERFFDPQKDPITEKAVRHGDEWLFVSFGGMVHPVDVAGEKFRPGEPWPLFDDTDRRASWRIGGGQMLALHGPSGRLYALVHQGGPDSHKDAGTEVWVYDLATRKRVQRVPMLNPLVSFIGVEGALDRDHTTGRIGRWLLERVLPNPGVERILVTQDPRPVLIASAGTPPTVTVHDAMTGDVLREISEPGIATSLLVTP